MAWAAGKRLLGAFMTVIDTAGGMIVGGAARRVRLAASRDRCALKLIEKQGPLTRAEVQKALDLPERSARHLLERLLRRRAIEKREGRYALAVPA